MDNIDKFGYSLYDQKLGELVIAQTGVFRTNCLDWYGAFSDVVRTSKNNNRILA